MKNSFFSLLFMMAVQAYAQSTPGLILSKGATIESKIWGYQTPLQQDAVKWIKMKPAKKAEAVLQFNEDIASGKITPLNETYIPTHIQEASEVNGQMVYTGTTRIGVADYKLTLQSSGDSIHYLLNDGLPFAIPGKNNDTTGIWCFGIRHLPKAPEVGTYLPGYINEMNLFPYDLKTSRREFFNFSGGDGYSYSGFVNVRKTRTMQINSIFVNTPYYVVAKEELTIGDKKYTAYKLLNEQWTKSNVNTIAKDDPTDFFNDKYLSDKTKENLANRGRGWDTPAKKAEILEQMQTQTGLVTNEQGYQVNLQENWYVPELGLMAKSRFFDGTGALQMESKIVSIK